MPVTPGTGPFFVWIRTPAAWDDIQVEAADGLEEDVAIVADVVDHETQDSSRVSREDDTGRAAFVQRGDAVAVHVGGDPVSERRHVARHTFSAGCSNPDGLGAAERSFRKASDRSSMSRFSYRLWVHLQPRPEKLDSGC